MHKFNDQGIILSLRPHGEHGGIVAVLTEHHGRYAAYVHGARSTKMRSLLEPGVCVDVAWQAKEEQQMGHFELELEQSPLTAVFADPLKLLALQAAVSLTDKTLPERQPHPAVYYGLKALIDSFVQDDEIWPALYIYWEMGLLKELGFGIDLSKCVVTGKNEDLNYVSPKSGSAVSEAGAGLYKDRLLKIPDFLKGQPMGADDIVTGLKLTGYFLQNRIFDSASLQMPEARERLYQKFLS